MKRAFVFLLALSLAQNTFASLGHSYIEDETPEYHSLCFGEGCDEDEDFPPNRTRLATDAEYIQARILSPSLILNRIDVENTETGEVITVAHDNEDIDYMTRDGALAGNMREAAYVLIPNYYFPSLYVRLAAKNGGGSLVAPKLTVWNECSGVIIGRYAVGSKCSARPIHPSLLNVMENNLTSIVGGRKVVLVHKGIMGDARHQAKKSLHNTGRAIDVAEVIVDGKSYAYSKAVASEKSPERAFFLKLMAGWESAVKSRCGKVVAATTINWTNADHRQHLHLGTTYDCKN